MSLYSFVLLLSARNIGMFRSKNRVKNKVFLNTQTFHILNWINTLCLGGFWFKCNTSHKLKNFLASQLKKWLFANISQMQRSFVNNCHHLFSKRTIGQWTIEDIGILKSWGSFFLFLARRVLALHWEVAKTIEQRDCNKTISLDKEQKKGPPKGTQTSAEFYL